MGNSNSISRKILLEELQENNQIELVEDVIFWALEHYAKRGQGTQGELVAYAIKERILDAEREAGKQ